MGVELRILDSKCGILATNPPCIWCISWLVTSLVSWLAQHRLLLTFSIVQNLLKSRRPCVFVIPSTGIVNNTLVHEHKTTSTLKTHINTVTLEIIIEFESTPSSYCFLCIFWFVFVFLDVQEMESDGRLTRRHFHFINHLFSPF